jgi:hypothetical protein
MICGGRYSSAAAESNARLVPEEPALAVALELL